MRSPERMSRDAEKTSDKEREGIRVECKMGK